MAARFLLDTNICICIAKRRPPALLARFESLRVGDVAMSLITYGELRFGAEKSVSRQASLETLERLVELVPVLALPAEAAVQYGVIRGRLEREGHPLGANDLWIAAHALAARLILVSNNTRVFERVPGLMVQNWVME